MGKSLKILKSCLYISCYLGSGLNTSISLERRFLDYSTHMEGQIWFLPRSLQLTGFQAYKLRVTHLYQLKQHNILASVGEDEEGINPLVSSRKEPGKTQKPENGLLEGD